MFKGKLAIFCLVTAALLTVAGMAFGGIIDPCRSYVEIHITVTPCPLMICPVGDTQAFEDWGWYLWICILDTGGVPVQGVPAADFWVIDCDPINNLTLCGGSASSDADSATNSAGMTTMSNTSLAGGGCADGLALVVQGFVIEDSLTNCTTAECLPVLIRSPDMNGDLVLTLVDLTLFAASYPPQPYAPCGDLDASGLITLVDLTLFAAHFGPPGHSCN